MGYKYIFWGLLFLLAIPINNFDILPDIVGYILIFLGLNRLKTVNTYFYKARILCLITIILSLVDLVNYQIINQDATLLDIGLTVFGIAYAIISLLLIYYICRGIEAHALDNLFHELAETAMKRWKIYFYANIVFLVSLPLVLLHPAFLIVVSFPIVILLFVSLIKLMGLMRMAETFLPKSQVGGFNR